MPNSKAIGAAYADPLFDEVTVSGSLTADIVTASGEIGYAVAAQGTVTQLTDKATAVTLNASAGQIVMNGATLNTLTNVTFTLNNSTISAKDVTILNVAAGATAGAYNCWVSSKATGSCTITVRNISGGNLSEAITINFAIIHCL
jgi:hypothetical protein